MPYSNDYLPFATGVSPTVISQGVYAALTARSTGFQAGVADESTVNKVWRQSSVVSAMVGQFTADYGTGNVVDDGNVATLEAQFKSALAAYAKSLVTSANSSTLTTSSPQSVSGNVYSTVTFPGTPIGFTNSGGVLTCTTAGIYSFSANIGSSQSTNITSVGLFVEIFQNSTLIAQNGDTEYNPAASTVFSNVGASNTVYVSVGDTIQVKASVYNNGFASSQTVTTGSFFTISKVG